MGLDFSRKCSVLSAAMVRSRDRQFIDGPETEKKTICIQSIASGRPVSGLRKAFRLQYHYGFASRLAATQL